MCSKLIFILLSISIHSLTYARNFTEFNSEEMIFRETKNPYLDKYPDKETMDIYNDQLRRHMGHLKCLADPRLKHKTFWNVSIAMGYLSHDLISLRVRSNYNCDNLAPVNNQDNSLTYDFKTRRVLQLQDIFLKKENTYNLLRKFIRESFRDKSCHEKLSFYIESEDLISDYLSFYLGSDRMHFQLIVPSGLKSCTHDFSIPYEVLLKSTSHSNILKELKISK